MEAVLNPASDAVAAALDARVVLYRVLWRAFAGACDTELLATLADDGVAAACNLVGIVEAAPVPEHIRGRGWARDPDAPLALDARKLLAQALEAGEAEGAETLRAEFERLFEAPVKAVAPPWESVYVCGEDLIFQPSTLEVRAAYRAAGYDASGYPHEADDHVAHELGFMATMGERAVRALAEGDAAAAREALGRQRAFVSTHLSAWLRPFAERLERGAPRGTGAFYPALAYLACALCAADEGLLGEVEAAL